MAGKKCSSCGGSGQCYDDKCSKGQHLSGLRRCRVCNGEDKCTVCNGTGRDGV